MINKHTEINVTLGGAGGVQRLLLPKRECGRHAKAAALLDNSRKR